MESSESNKSTFTENSRNRHLSEPNDDEYKTESLLYGVNDKPPWYMCLLLGFQHYLEIIGATVASPFILTPALCMLDDDPDKANIVNTLVFTSGIITILQVTFGTRLPIIQGGSFSYLLPSLAIMNLPKWKCPTTEEILELSLEERREIWQTRAAEIHGAVICAAAFEALFGLVGLIGFLAKFITPLTVAPALTLIGLALFKNVTVQVLKSPWVGLSMVTLLIIFSQHLRKIKLRNPFGTSKSLGFPIFRVFPVLMALTIVWGTCAILTYTNVLPIGNLARIDAKSRILRDSEWFRIPYPYQWGFPTVSLAAVLGMLCGILASTVESIGDYAACAKIAKMSPPPEHAMNRGIFIEGIGCVIGGILGSGNGSTSSCINIGTIGITQVASRRVFITSGLIMIALSLVGKAGAVFIGIPDPILGGLFAYTFPLCIAVGVGTLKDVQMDSQRNLFIFGFSIFTGIAVSQWAESNPGAIQTGSEGGDALIQILLNVGMFVAGFIGFVLDNTIPGSDEERGIKKQNSTAQTSVDPTYDLPWGMATLQRYKIFNYIPISPTYKTRANKKHPHTVAP